MFRLAIFVALQIALLSVAIEPTRAAEYGTADEAKAMLERAVAPAFRETAPEHGGETRPASPAFVMGRLMVI
jgi:hypothetical protein